MMTELEIRTWIAQLEKQTKEPIEVATFTHQAIMQLDRKAIALQIDTLRKVLGER